MSHQVRVLFDVGDTVLVNGLSPSTQFQVTSSSFDARSRSTTYRLKPKSGTKRIVIILGEENLALASDRSPVNPRCHEPSLCSQEPRDSRRLGQMINVKDAERSDTIETTRDGTVGFTRVWDVGNQPGLCPYFEYVNADAKNRLCFDQRVRLLAKSTSATRSSCTSSEPPPPVHRGKHPRYDEPRFEMLGLLHGGYSSGRLSEPLTTTLQALGISQESSRNPRRPQGAVAFNPRVENTEQDQPASAPEELHRSNKIDIGDLVTVTMKSGRPRKGWVARKSPAPQAHAQPSQSSWPRTKGTGLQNGRRDNRRWSELDGGSSQAYQEGNTPGEAQHAHKFPPCENEDFDIEAFESQGAATDAKEAANEEAYIRKKKTMSGNDEIEHGAAQEELQSDTEQNGAQEQNF